MVSSSSKEVEVAAARSADIEESVLQYDDTEVSISVFGDASFGVGKEIEVSIIVSGDVTYYGSPEFDSILTGLMI